MTVKPTEDAGLARREKIMPGMFRLPEKHEDFYAYDVIIMGPCEFDRLERERESDRERLQVTQTQGNRLLVAMGAMQRENERLAEELQSVRGQIAARESKPRRGRLRGFLGRLLH